MAAAGGVGVSQHASLAAMLSATQTAGRRDGEGAKRQRLTPLASGTFGASAVAAVALAHSQMND